MNIYIAHNLVQSLSNLGDSDAKQYRLPLKLQLSWQTSNFVQYGSKMWAEVGLWRPGLD